MSEKDIKEEKEKLLELSNLNKKDQILEGLKTAFIPLAGRFFDKPSKEQITLLGENLEWYLKQFELLNKEEEK